jgi:predicted DCC family thiol-disulfide oxidoreductase YuxK
MKVFYDGACPLCKREIGFFRKCKPVENVEWIDVSRLKTKFAHPGLSQEQALQRFHVVTPEGQLLSGGAAFSRLWCSIRAFRYFGLVFHLSPFAWMLDPIYDQFLKIRPWMQSRLR